MGSREPQHETSAAEVLAARLAALRSLADALADDAFRVEPPVALRFPLPTAPPPPGPAAYFAYAAGASLAVTGTLYFTPVALLPSPARPSVGAAVSTSPATSGVTVTSIVATAQRGHGELHGDRPGVVEAEALVP